MWPYLLGYHKYGSTIKEREDEDTKRAHEYKNLLAEWKNVELMLRKRTRVSETDRDSTAESVESKEDAFNDTPDNDPNDTRNDNDSLDNISFTNSFDNNDTGENYPGESNHRHNGTPSDHLPNDSPGNRNTGEDSPKSELDNESGCYDCDTGKLISACENSPACEKCSLCNDGVSEDRNGIINGYNRNSVDNCNETKHCTCENGGTPSLSRLSSYSVSFDFFIL